MPVLTRDRLAERLVDDVGLSRRDAREAVDLFFDTVAGTLEANEEVTLMGFGRFRLLEKGERPGRNPSTGEDAPVAARRVVAFRTATGLRDRIRAIDPPDAANTAHDDVQAARGAPGQPSPSASA